MVHVNLDYARSRIGKGAPIFLMLAPSVIHRQVIALTLILPEVNLNDQ